MIQETEELGEKTCPSATLSTTNSTRTVLGANLGFCGEKLVTNCLSYDFVLRTMYSFLHYTPPGKLVLKESKPVINNF
jgi:hypothetical protein